MNGSTLLMYMYMSSMYLLHVCSKVSNRVVVIGTIAYDTIMYALTMWAYGSANEVISE